MSRIDFCNAECRRPNNDEFPRTMNGSSSTVEIVTNEPALAQHFTKRQSRRWRRDRDSVVGNRDRERHIAEHRDVRGLVPTSYLVTVIVRAGPAYDGASDDDSWMTGERTSAEQRRERVVFPLSTHACNCQVCAVPRHANFGC